MKTLGKLSFGMGDRFGREGNAQLKAILKAREEGVSIAPVWNKSYREHLTVQSKPQSVREEADQAVQHLKFKEVYFVDADHINFDIVDDYLDSSDFFTIDVAQYIGQGASQKEKNAFLDFVAAFQKGIYIPGIDHTLTVSEKELDEIVDTFLFACQKASEVHQHIAKNKRGDFVVEVSMDEVSRPQSPIALFFILAALAFYKVPVSTVAPKFTGRFNKGVDYEGDLKKFEKEFEEDLQVLAFAQNEFALPEHLKLSIHSGSDKFSIYPIMNKLIKKYDAGLHVKTAGTTWVEEITVLAESSEEGFQFALEVYAQALDRFEELTDPYPDVLDINRKELPKVDDIKEKGRGYMAKALRHNPGEKAFNPHFRQLMHCAYKVAGEKSHLFYHLLETHREAVEDKVTENLYEKHIRPIFF